MCAIALVVRWQARVAEQRPKGEPDQSIGNRSSGNRVNCNPLDQQGFDDMRASNPS